MPFVPRFHRRFYLAAAVAVLLYGLTAGLLTWILSPRPRAVLDAPEHPGRMKWSADGRWLALGGTSQLENELYRDEIRVWDIADKVGQIEAALRFAKVYRDDFYWDCHFSPDGRYLALAINRDGTQLKTFQLHDLITGAVQTFTARSICFSPDGNQVAIVTHHGRDGQQRLRVVDTASGKQLAHLAQSIRGRHDHDAFVDIAFLPDGRTLRYTSRNDRRWAKKKMTKRNHSDGTILTLFDIPTKRQRVIIDARPTDVAPDKEQTKLAARAERFIDARDVNGFALSPDGSIFAGHGRFDWTNQRNHRLIRIWDVKTGTLTAEWKLTEFDWVEGLMIAADGATLVGVDRGEGVHQSCDVLVQMNCWDVRSAKLLTKFASGSTRNPDTRYCNPEGSFLPRFVVGNDKCDLNHWARFSVIETRTGQEVFVSPSLNPQRSPEAHFYFPVLSPDRRFVVVYDENVSALAPLFDWLAKWVWPAAADQKQAKRLRCWDITTGQEFPPLPGGGGEFVFSPDGATLVAVGDDGKIRLWDLPPRKPLGLILAWSCMPAMLVLLLAYSRSRMRKRPPA